MAGVAGVEPTSTVLETVVLPLNYTPKRSYIIASAPRDFNRKFHFFNFSDQAHEPHDEITVKKRRNRFSEQDDDQKRLELHFRQSGDHA